MNDKIKKNSREKIAKLIESRGEAVENYLIYGSLDIQPLIRMKNSLSKTLENSELSEGELYRTYQTSAVQVFEVSFEIAWKTLQKVLKSISIDVRHSKDTFREAFKINLIKDPKVWFDFLIIRNETSHSYDEDILDDIFDLLPEFIKELELLINNLKEFKIEETNYEKSNSIGN
jgi:nucleotidyltransferase substrate binding protein (TIGR01987 family)